MKNKLLKFPLYAKGEERVVKRSEDRVSKIGERTADVNILAAITHQTYASLGHPLFAARKEGKGIFLKKIK